MAGLQRTLLQFLAAIAVLIPYVACTGGTHLSALDGTGWVCLQIVGLVHTGITYCLYFSSLKELPGQAAAILSYIDPLVAVIVSVLVLGERITAAQELGGDSGYTASGPEGPRSPAAPGAAPPTPV